MSPRRAGAIGNYRHASGAGSRLLTTEQSLAAINTTTQGIQSLRLERRTGYRQLKHPGKQGQTQIAQITRRMQGHERKRFPPPRADGSAR